MTAWINLDYDGWFAAFAQARGGRGMTRKGKRVLLKNANRRTVEVWHDKYIPPHFDDSARRRYHYQQRKRIYRTIKKEIAEGMQVFIDGKELPPERIIKGGQVDLVRSGKTEAYAEAPTPVVASAGGAKTRVRVPGYVKKRRASQPNQAKELQTLTGHEKGRLAGVWKGQFYRDVRRFGGLFRLQRRLGKRSGKV